MKTLKSISLRAVAAAALVAIAGSAQAQLLNGSFELGSAQNSGFTQELGGSIAIANWLVVGDELAWFHNVFNGGQLTASAGTKFLDLTHLTPGCTPCGGVEQSFFAVGGTPYTLRFDLGSSALFSTPSAIQATVTGAQGGTLNPIFTSTLTGNINWETQTVSFIGNNAPVTIRLQGSAAAGDYVGLDNVSVTAIPEPGALALMLAGLAAVGSVASRRRVQR